MASAVTPGLQYDVSESAGVKVANREVAGPTGTLALVAKAGPRYQPFPGFADALEYFAFKVRPPPEHSMAARSGPTTPPDHKKSNSFAQLIDYPQTVGVADYSGG